MIKIKIGYNDNLIDNIKIIGHANFADYGKDIVCASVSSMVITTVNACLSINSNSLVYDELNGLFIKNIIDDEIIQKIVNNLINLLIELSNSYPKNINIEGKV